MRTKTVVLSALLGLAGAASVMAQTVYSLNTVGYVNIAFPANKFVMFANPLDTTNTLANLFSSLTDADTGCAMYIWDGKNKVYKTLTYDNGAGGWFDVSSDPVDANAYTLVPGQGAWFVAQNTFTNTFVGNVLQGNLTNAIYNGFSMVGSQVPQSADVTTLGLTSVVGDGENLFQYNAASGYTTFTYVAGDGWYNVTSDPVAQTPVLKVGEAVFVTSSVSTNWTRTFTVQ